MWRRAPKAVRSSRALLPDALTPATLVALVLDPPRRRALLAALGREHGSSVTLRNAYELAARRADATPDDLARVVAVLEAEGEVEALRAFVWHPSMPETVLLDLCERGVCVTELGHRAGPRSLIRRVAELHAYAEAILTLALDLYRDPTEPAEAFAAHARAHATHEWMLRTLAEVNGSDPEKEAIYEALLGASPDAAAYRARHLARSPGASTERLAYFLAAHPDPWLLTLLLRTELADADKRALVSRVAAARTDSAEIVEALARLRACEEASGDTLAPGRAAALFAAGDPEVLLALAGNPRTPPAILDELASRKGVRLAQPTRVRARATRRRARP